MENKAQRSDHARAPNRITVAGTWLVALPLAMTGLTVLLASILKEWPARMAPAVFSWPAFLGAILLYTALAFPGGVGESEMELWFWSFWTPAMVVFFIVFFLPMCKYKTTGKPSYRDAQIRFLVLYLAGAAFYVAFVLALEADY